jgi:hypothetical protein
MFDQGIGLGKTRNERIRVGRRRSELKTEPVVRLEQVMLRGGIGAL